MNINVDVDISIIHLLILALATWRLSSLLVDEDGLFSMFEKLRTWVGVRYTKGETGELEQVVPDDLSAIRRTVAGWLTCRWCCSLWVGAILTVAYIVWGNVVYIALPWSISAFAIIIDALIGRRYRRRVYFG